jgi:hypothetical protein
MLTLVAVKNPCRDRSMQAPVEWAVGATTLTRSKWTSFGAAPLCLLDRFRQTSESRCVAGTVVHIVSGINLYDAIFSTGGL